MPGLIGKKILLCGFYGKPSIEIDHKAIEEMFNTDVIKPINLSHMGLRQIGFRDLPKPEIKPLTIKFELSEQHRRYCSDACSKEAIRIHAKQYKENRKQEMKA